MRDKKRWSSEKKKEQKQKRKQRFPTIEITTSSLVTFGCGILMFSQIIEDQKQMEVKENEQSDNN